MLQLETKKYIHTYIHPCKKSKVKFLGRLTGTNTEQYTFEGREINQSLKST